jgi:decaprenylphospho-beta-D-ribofuranose 2-oxidase
MSLLSTKIPSFISGWEMVSSYAETRNTQALVAYPTSIDECSELIEFSKKCDMTVCPRGGGFTWGDMILNNGHIIIDFSMMKQILNFELESGKINVQPGVQFVDVFRKILPKNWTLPSCPGGAGVTIGGAISNNVHGKDSWASGNFGDHVISMKLLLSSGKLINVCRENNRPMFEAVVGGMGLLGIIVEATLQLKKVPSPYVEVSSIKVGNIRESLSLFDEKEKDSDFAVMWADAFSTGNKLGRGCVKTAKWSKKNLKISSDELESSLKAPSKIFGILPPKPVYYLGRPLFKPWTIRYANKLIYFFQKNSQKTNISTDQRLTFIEYNFMFGMKFPFIRQLFLPYGMLEFEHFIPKSAGVEAVEELFKLFQRYHCEPLFCGIKVHRDDNYMISFAGDGYSIGGGIQVRGRDLNEVNKFARAVSEYTLECGGKILLSKDEMLFRDIFQKMYPRHNEFIKVKKELDPIGLFSSDMYRRLIKPLD